MKWFGKTWGAPVCSYTDHVATPVGQLCFECKTPILAEDTGFLMPHLHDHHRWFEEPMHRGCFMASVLGERKALEIEEGEQ